VLSPALKFENPQICPLSVWHVLCDYHITQQLLPYTAGIAWSPYWK